MINQAYVAGPYSPSQCCSGNLSLTVLLSSEYCLEKTISFEEDYFCFSDLFSDCRTVPGAAVAASVF